jgi:hypothetical protein
LFSLQCTKGRGGKRKDLKNESCRLSARHSLVSPKPLPHLLRWIVRNGALPPLPSFYSGNSPQTPKATTESPLTTESRTHASQIRKGRKQRQRRLRYGHRSYRPVVRGWNWVNLAAGGGGGVAAQGAVGGLSRRRLRAAALQAEECSGDRHAATSFCYLFRSSEDIARLVEEKNSLL